MEFPVVPYKGRANMVLTKCAFIPTFDYDAPNPLFSLPVGKIS